MSTKTSSVVCDPLCDPWAGQRRRGMFFIALATASVGFVMNIQGGVNANFVAQTIGASGFQAGLLEAARETCGIAALGILAILAGLAQPLVASSMLLLVAVGIASYAFAPSYGWVVLLSLVWSQGLHVWMPLPNSMTLALAEKNRAGFRLGQIQTAGAIGAGLGCAVALPLIYLHRKGMIALDLVGKVYHWAAGIVPLSPTCPFASDPLRDLYLVAGVIAVVGAAACLFIPRGIKTPGPRIIFRKKYGLYYLMSFLEGWRKQIFMCFAGFMLVKIYQTDLLTMFMLAGLVQVFGWILSPRIGRLIDRVGERKVLLLYYISMTLVFVGYAAVPNVYVLYGLFVVDGTFFLFAMAMSTYVNRIAPKSEHTPTFSAGVAMNHIAAVTTPLVSGLLWGLGFKYVFLLGSVAAVASIAVAWRVPKHVPAGEAATVVPAEENE